MKATRRRWSGLAVVRRHCKHSTNTGLLLCHKIPGIALERGAGRSGNPTRVCSGSSSLPKIPASKWGGLPPALLSPASCMFNTGEMETLGYFSRQVIIIYSSWKKKNHYANPYGFSLRGETPNTGLKKTQLRIWWWWFFPNQNDFCDGGFNPKCFKGLCCQSSRKLNQLNSCSDLTTFFRETMNWK